MAEQLFQLGDQVKLKSGGPAMTINNIKEYNDSFQISCTWFNNQKMETGVFIQESLKKYKPEDDVLGIYVG